MKGTLDQPPIVLTASRLRAVWLILGATLFVFGGVLVLRSGGAPVQAMLTIGFFGLCGVLGVVMLVTPARLEIGPAGIRQKVLWRAAIFAWTDVYNFRSVNVGLSSTVVGFDFLNGPPGRAKARQMSKAISGAEGTLQSGFMRPDKLALLLNEARERWLVQTGDVPVAGPTVASTVRQPLLAAFGGARVDRKTYWIGVCATLAIGVALSFIPGARIGVTGLTTVLFARVFTARLHDLGRSGWWQMVVYALMLGTIVAAMAAKLSENVALGLAFLIQFAFTVGLGSIPGQQRTNRFGPPSKDPSPYALSETFR